MSNNKEMVKKSFLLANLPNGLVCSHKNPTYTRLTTPLVMLNYIVQRHHMKGRTAKFSMH